MLVTTMTATTPSDDAVWKEKAKNYTKNFVLKLCLNRKTALTVTKLQKVYKVRHHLHASYHEHTVT